MAETMGQIIKRLRKERSLTQEELAEQLGISAPAVSKWENNTAMPDISQIVPLANLFGVTTDVLFGTYGIEHEGEVISRLEEIYEIYDSCKQGEEGTTALIILEKYRDAIHTYPNNPTLLLEASAFGTMILQNNESELKDIIGDNGIISLSNEIIHWAELVVKYSSSVEHILSAKRYLIDNYVFCKNLDAAYALAETFPNSIENIRGFLMADLKYRTSMSTEEKTHRCDNIYALSSRLGHEVSTLGNLYMREGRLEDALYCYTFLRNMIEAMYTKEKYRPPFIFDYYPMYRFPSECLVRLDRIDEAIELLNEGIDFILFQAKNYNKKKQLDIPLFADCLFGYGHDGNAKYPDLSARLKRFLDCDTLKLLENNSKYKALLEKVNDFK